MVFLSRIMYCSPMERLGWGLLDVTGDVVVDVVRRVVEGLLELVLEQSDRADEQDRDQTDDDDVLGHALTATTAKVAEVLGSALHGLAPFPTGPEWNPVGDGPTRARAVPLLP